MKKAVPFIIFGIIAALLVVSCGALGVAFADRTFVAETAPEKPLTEFVSVVDSVAELNTAYYDELAKMKDLQDLFASWATSNNDAKMHLNTVKTYLIVVKEAGTVTTNYGNADIIHLVSVNSEAKKVSVIAVDPDSLVYIDLAGSGMTSAEPVYAKLNTAYANGGIQLLEKTIENNFKIEVDHYLVTDMDGVAAVVKAIDGISVMLDKNMKDMITDDFNVIMPANNTPLNGQQAVAYLREKRDGAENRMDRLADTLVSVVKTTQNLSFIDAFNLVKILADVTVTDLSGSDLISVLRATLLGGWNNYSVVAYVASEAESAVSYKDSAWIHIIDVPVVAQSVQNKLFNKTNITLNESRLSAVSLIDAVNKLYFDELNKVEEPVDENAENSELSGGEETPDGENENTETEDVGSVG